MKKKWIVAGITGILATTLAMSIAMAQPVAQSTVLNGKVASVVPVGTVVKEGDVILKVETIGGPMVAARATANGTVAEVHVSPGTTVVVGQHVAVINSK